MRRAADPGRGEGHTMTECNVTEYTVTFRLTPEQEAIVNTIADSYGVKLTTAKMFEHIMQVGSAHDINDKLAFWSRTMSERTAG